MYIITLHSLFQSASSIWSFLWSCLFPQSVCCGVYAVCSIVTDLNLKYSSDDPSRVSAYFYSHDIEKHCSYSKANPYEYSVVSKIGKCCLQYCNRPLVIYDGCSPQRREQHFCESTKATDVKCNMYSSLVL